MGSETLGTYGRVKALFEEVCELPEAEREARFAQHGHDPEVVAEVRALLEHETGHSRFAQPVVAAMGQLATEPVKAGDTLGPWQLVAEIGHGGMGKVFSARRIDGHYEQSAAIKVLRGVPTASALEYLARERQILAQMSHPNIARLLDGGTTPGGQPYLVMEFVEGTPIDRYCIDGHLPLAATLRLFATVCEAVAFAHTQLVVHCDLKPSNILVDRNGRPVLLDFGIARLLGSSVLEAAAGSSDSPAYTPRYASPEQRAGQAVSTASDVFSLGVILGELVTGAAAELRAAIDRATHPDPSRRYASVRALAVDLENFLAHRPLQAVAPSLSYRARKLAQRRWPWLIAAAVFAFMTAGFALRLVAERDRAQVAEGAAVTDRDATRVAQSQALRERDRAGLAERQAAAERDRAVEAERIAVVEKDRALGAGRAAASAERAAIEERNRAVVAEGTSRQVSEFLVSIFDQGTATPTTGDIPVSTLVAKAEQRLQGKLAGQPSTQSELYSALARVHSNIGNEKAARANHLRALEIERGLNRPLVLAERLHRMAYHGLLNLMGKPAHDYALEAVALREKHAPGSVALADSLSLGGRTATAMQRFSEGAQLLERAMEIGMRHEPEGALMAEILHRLAFCQWRADKVEASEQNYKRALALAAKLYGEEHPQHLVVTENYAALLGSMRRYEEAEAIMRRSVELRRRLHGRDLGNVSHSLHMLGRFVGDAGRPREALEPLLESRRIIAQVSGADSPQYGNVTNVIGGMHLHMADYAGAEREFGEAYRIGLGRTDVLLLRATAQRNLGRTQMLMGKMQAAGENLSQSLAALKTRWNERHSQVVDGKIQVAEWRIAAGQIAEAKALLDEVAPALPTHDPLDQIAYDRLRALLDARQGRVDEALRALEAVERARFKSRGDRHPASWLGMLDRARILAARAAMGDRESAAAIATQVLERVAPILDPGSPALEELRQLRGP